MNEIVERIKAALLRVKDNPMEPVQHMSSCKSLGGKAAYYDTTSVREQWENLFIFEGILHIILSVATDLALGKGFNTAVGSLVSGIIVWGIAVLIGFYVLKRWPRWPGWVRTLCIILNVVSLVASIISTLPMLALFVFAPITVLSSIASTVMNILLGLIILGYLAEIPPVEATPAAPVEAVPTATDESHDTVSE